jgi:hypothetical protein
MLDTVQLNAAHKMRLLELFNMPPPWQIYKSGTVNHHMKSFLEHHHQ